jgi:hypothetical protein
VKKIHVLLSHGASAKGFANGSTPDSIRNTSKGVQEMAVMIFLPHIDTCHLKNADQLGEQSGWQRVVDHK